MPNSLVIAIDGPAASGKGTIARRLAAHFDFAHLDTGLLYRAAGLLADGQGLDGEPSINAFIAEGHFIDGVLAKMEDPALRGDHAAQSASRVAALPSVRAALLKLQQDFWTNPPGGKVGAVLDGRDIGTVIAPKAPVKIFVTASIEARAHRRWAELQKHALQAGVEAATETTVLAEMKERDARDASRSIAPAKPAPDAVFLDTTTMTADEAFQAALMIATGKMPGR